MGFNFGQRRQRSSSMVNPGDVTSSSLGTRDINLDHLDEELISDQINAKLDIQEAKIKKKTEEFER